MRAVLLGIAALALAVPALVVRYAPAMPHVRMARVKAPGRIVTPAELPPVEPVELQDLTPDEARAWNAAVPFVDGPNPAARPFRFRGSDEQRARATDCLAAALWYEAGDDPVGERAVAQVVLNRLRHPAFPKTVCGVVFQGSERATGCQFTFTCDGAMDRVAPGEDAWRRARRIADAALDGAVERKVGYATHYHTDWVVPYWSASLDKIAEVHTHLFFRWTGWWGTPPAFRRTVSSDEPMVDKLAKISPAHGMGAAMQAAAMAVAAGAPLAGLTPGRDDEPDTFTVPLAGIAPELFADMARTACGTRERCKFMGWTDKAQLPPVGATPNAAQMAAMSFSYLRDQWAGLERELWNCGQFPKAPVGQCMKRGVATVAVSAPAASPTSARGPEELGGVRRVNPPAPVATPTVGVPAPRVGVK